jgi:hypothetical protein
MTQLTISVVGGKIDITSDDNKKGGNIRARSGRRIVWIAGAGVTNFSLKFMRLDDGDGAINSSDDWPFLRVKSLPAAGTDEDACTVNDATKVMARLAPDYGEFKYTVSVNPQGAAPDLDPMIIVGR